MVIYDPYALGKYQLLRNIACAWHYGIVPKKSLSEKGNNCNDILLVLIIKLYFSS